MTNGTDYDQPATYEIHLKGTLDPTWSDWFDGFNITSWENESTLVGVVTDQGALHGLFAKINELGLSIVSLRQLPGSDPLVTKHEHKDHPSPHGEE